jgi:hypothetical protein
MTGTGIPVETATPVELPGSTSDVSKPSKLSKFRIFSKKQPPSEEKTRLVDKSEEQTQKDQKNKELIMKYRNMTEEEADKYLEQKKTGKDGLNTERGLRALGTALAPVRL